MFSDRSQGGVLVIPGSNRGSYTRVPTNTVSGHNLRVEDFILGRISTILSTSPKDLNGSYENKRVYVPNTPVYHNGNLSGRTEDIAQAVIDEQIGIHLFSRSVFEAFTRAFSTMGMTEHSDIPEENVPYVIIEAGRELRQIADSLKGGEAIVPEYLNFIRSARDEFHDVVGDFVSSVDDYRVRAKITDSNIILDSRRDVYDQIVDYISERGWTENMSLEDADYSDVYRILADELERFADVLEIWPRLIDAADKDKIDISAANAARLGVELPEMRKEGSPGRFLDGLLPHELTTDVTAVDVARMVLSPKGVTESYLAIDGSRLVHFKRDKGLRIYGEDGQGVLLTMGTEHARQEVIYERRGDVLPGIINPMIGGVVVTDPMGANVSAEDIAESLINYFTRLSFSPTIHEITLAFSPEINALTERIPGSKERLAAVVESLSQGQVKIQFADIHTLQDMIQVQTEPSSANNKRRVVSLMTRAELDRVELNTHLDDLRSKGLMVSEGEIDPIMASLAMIQNQISPEDKYLSLLTRLYGKLPFRARRQIKNFLGKINIIRKHPARWISEHNFGEQVLSILETSSKA